MSTTNYVHCLRFSSGITPDNVICTDWRSCMWRLNLASVMPRDSNSSASASIVGRHCLKSPISSSRPITAASLVKVGGMNCCTCWIFKKVRGGQSGNILCCLGVVVVCVCVCVCVRVCVCVCVLCVCCVCVCVCWSVGVCHSCCAIFKVKGLHDDER